MVPARGGRGSCWYIAWCDLCGQEAWRATVGAGRVIARDLPCSVKLLVVSSGDGNRSRHDWEEIRFAGLLRNDLVLNKKQNCRLLRTEITGDVFGISYGHFSIIWGRDYVCGRVCACTYVEVRVHVCVFMHMYVCTCTCIHVYTYAGCVCTFSLTLLLCFPCTSLRVELFPQQVAWVPPTAPL